MTVENGLPDYTPTPAEIRRACLEIQATWSPQERYARAHDGRLPLRETHMRIVREDGTVEFAPRAQFMGAGKPRRTGYRIMMEEDA